MGSALATVTLVVDDYDEAIRFYTAALGFELVADIDLGGGRRWVLVRPGSAGAAVLLARAEDGRQASRVGDQTGGRVALFLETDDFAASHARMLAAGVRFHERPRTEPYGTVAVFEDLYGTTWDLIEPSGPPLPLRLAIVGNGRMGTALVRRLRGAEGPFGRGFDGSGFDAVLLAVPDGQITAASASILGDVLVGHTSGASGIDLLGDRERFGVHPLLTVTGPSTVFRGAAAAVAGSSERAMSIARLIVESLQMQPFAVDDADRAAYHAAASIGANFLVTLADAAERLAATSGTPRSALAPLVLAAAANWSRLGGAALTGPIARGDTETVARQRGALGERTPELLDLFDVLAAHTAALAARNG